VLLFRVFAAAPNAREGQPGHPTYLHRPQGSGRWDNPSLYDAWYLATTIEGAVIEAFGNLQTWSENMFDAPYFQNGRRTLAVFSAPDDLSLVNLDDAQTLLEQGMRPTQVVIRNPEYTQMRAAAMFAGKDASGDRRWSGISWWSFHRPTLTNVMLWSTPTAPAPLRLMEQRNLSIVSPEIEDASRSLAKMIASQ
jgi:hypothetical protein